jgi:hypothetical protein
VIFLYGAFCCCFGFWLCWIEEAMNVSKKLSMRLKMAHVANQIHELLEMLMLGLQSLIMANYACHIVKLCYSSCNGNTQSEPSTDVWSCRIFSGF